MKLQIISITKVEKHFSKKVFDVQYNLDGDSITERKMSLDHKKFEKFKKLKGVIEIPDNIFDSLEEAMEWYLQMN